MKICGHKCFGQDSAVTFIDTDKKEIFALNADRVSRIKKDNYDISPVLDVYSSRFKDVDICAYSFGVFRGLDAVLETKGTSYYWLNWQRHLRKITKPKYLADIHREKSAAYRIIIFLKSLMRPQTFYYKLLRDYFWKQYMAGTLPENFHQTKVHQYIVELFGRYGIYPKKFEYLDHHTCHAISALYSSPFHTKQRVLALTLDEHGDEYFSKLFIFEKGEINLVEGSPTEKFFIEDQSFVTSVAGMYSNFTQAMGLVRSVDEGKVEALAAYGSIHEPTYNELCKAIEVKNLTFKVDLDYYKTLSDISYLESIKEKIGEKDFCSTIQVWLEDVAVEYLNAAHKKYPADYLCLAGGATANVIMNYKIYERTPFKDIFIVPAMGDEGSGYGAAIYAGVLAGEDMSWIKDITMPYFGPQFSRSEVKETLDGFDRIKYEYVGDGWIQTAGHSISQNKIIAVFHGRMEFGPRALGNRSIMANAADIEARDRINSHVKKRPWYQPLCPSLLESERERLFVSSFPHKHMATAFLMRKEFWGSLPSAIHVDGTARPQFVEKQDNPNFYLLLQAVKERTGFGCVLNTSFNLHGRTVVHTPEDAIVDFVDCNLDELYIEGHRVWMK